MHIDYILHLFEKLHRYLLKYGDDSVSAYINILSNAVEILHAENCQNPEALILDTYKKLYYDPNGLSHYCIVNNPAHHVVMDEACEEKKKSCFSSVSD